MFVATSVETCALASSLRFFFSRQNELSGSFGKMPFDPHRLCIVAINSSRTVIESTPTGIQKSNYFVMVFARCKKGISQTFRAKTKSLMSV